MLSDQQKQFLTGFFENLPGLSYLVLYRVSHDLRLAGWIGTALAAMVCIAYVKRLLRPHPVLLGINVFMVAITPLIELLHLSGNASVAKLMLGNLDTLILGSVFATGLILTVFTSEGFLAHRAESLKKMRIQSGYLLSACAAGITWSLAVGDNHLVSLALPLSLIFGLRQFLIAGATDRQSRHDALLVAPAIAPPTDQSI
ncbi:hypothetical protein [Ruegeria halocynthiae]|uniref:hypothetical protein n=1 Tax=Ruegeria halocynthiae TaxID=985054 RepID=UPI000AC87CE0|nr:hypothetical protein [Ruegeria halocynthiae]